MDFKKKKFLEVRGLGNRDKLVVVSNCIASSQPDLVCLQETKLRVMSDMIVKEVCGLNSISWLALPSWRALGGILLLWNADILEVLVHEIGAYSVSIRCRLVGSFDEWVFSGVCSPTVAGDVVDFLEELDDIFARWNLPWCLGGDFNLVRYSHERKGDVCQDRKMALFGDFINRWRLIDGPLKGAKFMWSNFQDRPSLSRLD